MGLTQQQEKILESKSKNLVVSASAGSGKTFVLIEKLIDLICQKKIPVSPAFSEKQGFCFFSLWISP